MINNKNNTDDFLKDLIQKSDIENPSVDFTNKVMKEVEAYSEKKSVLILLIKKINNWYYLAAVGLLALIYLTYYFIPFENLSLFDQYDPAFISVFLKIYFITLNSFSIHFKYRQSLLLLLLQSLHFF